MARKALRVGLIGLGAIGRGVVQWIDHTAANHVEIIGACVRDPSRDRDLDHIRTVDSASELLGLKPDVVVEIAGHDGLKEHGPAVLRSGVDLIIVSVGAMADPEIEQALLSAAEEGGAQMKVASGAIGGLDAIASAAIGGLDQLTHTTRKPARTLLGDEAEGMTAPRELFAGTAREAALRFPESVNVAAAVSLAGLGLDRTQVRVIADPNVERNQHEVVAEGTFGRLRFEIQGFPTEDNPKTGRIVAMSIVHTLLMRRQTLVIG